MIDETTYRRSIDYTLAKGRFGEVVTFFDVVLLIGLFFGGVLPSAFGTFMAAFGTSVLPMAGFLFATGVALSLVSLPLSWYAQFKLEDRFGFNTITLKTWILDHVKGFFARGVTWVSVTCASAEADRVDWPKRGGFGGRRL